MPDVMWRNKKCTIVNKKYYKMLEKLFTSKNRVKLLEFFALKNRAGRLREISRDAKIPVSAVSRELKNLSDLGIIKKEKDIFMLNEDCNYLDDLRNILIKTDSFKFELEKIIHNKNIDFAFIFGSFASDSYDAGSDIDLFVVGDISNEEIFKIITPLEKKLGREINPVVWSLKELKKKGKSSFVSDIFKKKIIMVSGEENELQKIVGRE